MRHRVLPLGTLALGRCVAESHQRAPPPAGPMGAPDRSQETLREKSTGQRRWAARRPPRARRRDERTRSGWGQGRIAIRGKRFGGCSRLVERATWIPEAVPECCWVRPDPDRLLAAFGRRGRNRKKRFSAADVTARALRTTNGVLRRMSYLSQPLQRVASCSLARARPRFPESSARSRGRRGDTCSARLQLVQRGWVPARARWPERCAVTSAAESASFDSARGVETQPAGGPGRPTHAAPRGRPPGSRWRARAAVSSRRNRSARIGRWASLSPSRTASARPPAGAGQASAAQRRWRSISRRVSWRAVWGGHGGRLGWARLVRLRDAGGEGEGPRGRTRCRMAFSWRRGARRVKAPTVAGPAVLSSGHADGAQVNRVHEIRSLFLLPPPWVPSPPTSRSRRCSAAGEPGQREGGRRPRTAARSPS